MNQQQGREPGVIFLNGPSSSGKSTLVKTLQDALKTPYLHIGIDKIIGMMPEKLNDWDGGEAEQGFWWKLEQDTKGHTLAHLQMGPFAHLMSDFFMKIVVLALECGHSVIMDEVSLHDGNFEQWKKLLSPWTVLYVGVTTGDDILEKREQERGDRMKGSARAQNALVHQNKQYDMEVDTGTLTPEACSSKILASAKNKGLPT